MDTGRAVNGQDGTGLDGPGTEGHYGSFKVYMENVFQSI